MEYTRIMKCAQIITIWISLLALFCSLCAGRTVRQADNQYAHCQYLKGQYPPNKDGNCAESAPWDEAIGCCVKCVLYCDVGQKKAVIGKCRSKCVDCPANTFNNNTQNEEGCLSCTSCAGLSRDTAVPCTKESDSECGNCIGGYYPSSKDNTSPCLLCEGEANEQEAVCISYNVAKQDKKLDIYLIIGVVGGILLLVIVIVISVCTVKKVQKRRETIRRRNSRNDHEMKNLVNKDNPDSSMHETAIQTGPSLKGNSEHKVSGSAQTGPSLGYVGNGGTDDSKPRVSFAEPKKKPKGILKVDVNKANPRKPGDGQPDPPSTSDPAPSTGSSLETKSPGDFCSKPWWLSRSTSNPSPNESFISNEVFSDKNTPVPETPEYKASLPPYQKPPSLNSCVSRQSSNFQSLPSDNE